MKKLALYIHVPFCVQKCLYCDFLSMPANQTIQEAYITALIGELRYWQKQLEGQYALGSIFIGGGTPTVLAPELLWQMGEVLHGFSKDSNMEFTIEANPGTLTAEHIPALQYLGVNRISLGLQSAQEQELQQLGRIHSFLDFVESYRLLQEQGFSNINIDLMADIPGQTMESYADTLDKVLRLQPKHISAYSLLIEEGTPFYEMDQQGKLQIPSEETDRQMYARTKEQLAAEGYQRYEISNYAQSGWECRHNLTYWQMGEYLGVGLGAASYWHGKRFCNERDLHAYLSQKADCHIVERQILSKQEEMEEYVFLGLRMTQGISPEAYWKRFGVDFYQLYQKILPDLQKNGLLAETKNHDRIYLTDRGIDVSNTVFAEFLLA